MNLNDMVLPPYLVALLYPQSLNMDIIQNNTPAETAVVTKTTEIDLEWKFLGKNLKKILILVNCKDALHIPELALAFLNQLLNACKLTLPDVAILNINNFPETPYDKILSHFNPNTILLFGSNTIVLPFETQDYRVQHFEGKIFVNAPNLEDIQREKSAKIKLWTSLKIIFNI